MSTPELTTTPLHQLSVASLAELMVTASKRDECTIDEHSAPVVAADVLGKLLTKPAGWAETYQLPEAIWNAQRTFVATHDSALSTQTPISAIGANLIAAAVREYLRHD